MAPCPSSSNLPPGVFLTQEDIDQALSAPPPAAANLEAMPLDELDIVPTAESGNAPEDDDFFGLLSQEDISALLHGDLVGGAKSDQADIDALLNQATAEKGTGEGGRKPSPQDEVEQLFQQAAVSKGGDESPAPLIAQDDIDQLMRGALAEAGPVKKGPPLVPEKGSLIGQEDIDQLMRGALAEAGPVKKGPDLVQEEGSLISQDDIDQLMRGALAEAGPVKRGPDLVPEEDSIISQDDIELLLKGTLDPEDPVVSLPAGAGKAEVVSQSDIDALLMGTLDADGSGWEPSEKKIHAVAAGLPKPEASDIARTSAEHISQDELNRLLRESLELEPDASEPREEMTDILSGLEVPEPVILAEAEPHPRPVERRKFRFPKPGLPGLPHFFQGKDFFVGAAAGSLVVFLVLLGGLFALPKKHAPVPPVMTFSVPGPDKTTAVPVSIPTNLRFPGFVVLAPSNSAAVAFLSADLVITVSGEERVADIKENEAYVRDMIYRTISGELAARGVSSVTGDELSRVILSALRRVLPGVDQVAFEKFKTV